MKKPAKKMVPVTLVIHTEREVPADWDDDLISFHIEENSCRDTDIERFARAIDDDPSHCKTCFISAAFVGHIPFDEIRERAEERARVVSWLRELPPPWDERVDPETVSMWCADQIAAGEHAKGST